MINIFSEHITERLLYVLDFCFKEKGEEYTVVTATDEWNALEYQHVNYSNQSVTSALQIIPEGILFESEIHLRKQLSYVDDTLKIDGVADIFGVIFYLLSRYEAYFSSNSDDHGRMSAKNNALVNLKLHHQVVVDRSVKEMWEKLNLNYSTVAEKYNLVPTFDIDVAWAYKQRKLLRSVGAVLKGRKPLERIKVLAGLKKDPYDTYAEIREIAAKTEQIICFTLLGDWGKYDKNIHWQNGAYGSLIRGLNLEGEVGIHPSYASFLNKDKVEEEIRRLEEITGHEISLSRQHFLRLKIPETYQILSKLNITDDFSMGFADQAGFRAGTCFPFYFFDLENNRKTTLKIHPFAYMDSALKDYLKLKPEAAIRLIESLLNEVRAVGGEFHFIWHNSSIHDTGEWKGWKAVLDFTVKTGLI